MLICAPVLLVWLQAPAPAPVPDQPAGGVESAEAQQSAGTAGDARARARDWWERLSPEEKDSLRRRHDEFQGLPAEGRAEMLRRFDAVARERRRVWSELDEQQRSDLAARPAEERMRRLDEIVHERLRRRHEELEGRLPGPPPDAFHGPGLRERLAASGRLIEELRGQDVLRELGVLHEEGWIGSQAMEWLGGAPLAEQAAVLLDARKWRGLAHARAAGKMSAWNLSACEEQLLADMPSRDCLIAMSELERGLPRDEVFGRRVGPPLLPGQRPWHGRWRPGPPERGSDTAPRRFQR